MTRDDAIGNKQVHASSPGGVSLEPGSKVLWVASTGGHLTQLSRISSMFEVSGESMWVTFDSPQSRSLLDGKRRTFVDYTSPRDWRGAVKAARDVIPLLRSERFDYCISTGAAVATFILPLARLRGISTMYIESVSRTDGPSLTGRMMARIPGVRTYTQHESWADRRWEPTKSVLDAWKPVPARRASGQRTILVTLGTIRPYRFDRLVDGVLAVARPDDAITWQLGATDRADLPGDVHTEMHTTDLMALAERADIVVTHAGVGSILGLLDLGIAPVLGVRASVHGEHVDDHQQQIAREMTRRGLAFILDLDRPDAGTLEHSSATKVEQASTV